MIPVNLRVTLITAVLCYFIIILKFLKDKALSLKYSLVWLFSGAALGVLIAFPQLLSFLVHMLGIQSNMNGLFIFCIGFIIIILMTITSIVTRLNHKVRILIQEVAMLEKRVRELESEADGRD